MIDWPSVLLGFVPGLLIGAVSMLYLVAPLMRFIAGDEG